MLRGMKPVSAPAFQYHFTRTSRRYPALGAEIRKGVGLGGDICDSLDRFTLRAYSTGKDEGLKNRARRSFPATPPHGPLPKTRLGSRSRRVEKMG